MARSWQYARWRRIVVQVVLWVVFAATLGVAALVVRHKRLVGWVELTAVRTVDLPGGVVVGVRLPKGWPVDHDAAEHNDGADDGDGPTAVREAVRAFQAHEPAGGVGGTRDPEAGPVGRGLVILCQPLPVAVGAMEYLNRTGLLSHPVDATDDGDAATAGAMPVAGVEGYWATIDRPVAMPAGERPVYAPAYVAAGVVPAGPTTPTAVAVTVVLDCPPGDADVAGDRDLLRRVAAAVTVGRGLADAWSTTQGVPTSMPLDR
jgi:hypothetical protein